MKLGKFRNVTDFEKVDEALLPGLKNSHSKIPVLSLFIELGVQPLRFTFAAIRNMHLQTILARDNTELIKKVYIAQKLRFLYFIKRRH